VANAFSNLFTTITKKLNMQQMEKGDGISILKDLFPLNILSIIIILITEAEIKHIMHSLKPKKSSCYNEITTKILKACASLISHPFSYLYNHSVCIGIFPDCLKSAVVNQLCKKADKTNVKNYRPIS
jgi:hypothetical protein